MYPFLSVHVCSRHPSLQISAYISSPWRESDSRSEPGSLPSRLELVLSVLSLVVQGSLFPPRTWRWRPLLLSQSTRLTGGRAPLPLRVSFSSPRLTFCLLRLTLSNCAGVFHAENQRGETLTRRARRRLGGTVHDVDRPGLDRHPLSLAQDEHAADSLGCHACTYSSPREFRSPSSHSSPITAHSPLFDRAGLARGGKG